MSNKIFENLWKRLRELFSFSTSIPPPVNRKERRMAQSMARRKRMHAFVQSQNEGEGDEHSGKES